MIIECMFIVLEENGIQEVIKFGMGSMFLVIIGYLVMINL